MSTGSAQITIDRPPAEVWAAIADVTRMGEWSPECIAGRWVAGATGPAVGAKFEGDNVAKVAGRVVKRWTTTSEVTACEPGSSFEFIAEEYTTWRYRFEPAGAGTLVTESFEYTAKGFMGVMYDTVLFRPRMMSKGMQATLERVKVALEQ
jgi:ligand-binding SRPBCC domain-containing protein